MLSTEFLPILQEYGDISKHFLGTFPIDGLPQEVKDLDFFIINTEYIIYN